MDAAFKADLKNPVALMAGGGTRWCRAGSL